MREEDKNYNLEEDDEDENFMIGGTLMKNRKNRKNRKERRKQRPWLTKNLKERLRPTKQRTLKEQIPKRRKKE